MLHSHDFICYLREKKLLLCSASGIIKFNWGQFAITLAPPPLQKWNYKSAFSILTLISTVGAGSTGADSVAVEVDCLPGLQPGGNLI